MKGAAGKCAGLGRGNFGGRSFPCCRNIQFNLPTRSIVKRMKNVGFVAYIDESGDDGIAKVAPLDEGGASEWFVLSAVLVRKATNPELGWVRGILSDLDLRQRRTLHFQRLDEQRRLRVCEAVAELPIRGFVVGSNKLNMRGYTNPRAANVYAPARNWFYWWMARLLLERVTDYCYRRSMREVGKPQAVRFEFARRGGLRYSHFQAYLRWLKMQSRGDALYLRAGDLAWDVIDFDQVAAFDPIERAGLQLSDIAASAFFQAVSGKQNQSFAKALAPRVAMNQFGDQFGYGLKIMPAGYVIRGPEPHRDFFRFFQQKKWRAPGP